MRSVLAGLLPLLLLGCGDDSVSMVAVDGGLDAVDTATAEDVDTFDMSEDVVSDVEVDAADVPTDVPTDIVLDTMPDVPTCECPVNEECVTYGCVDGECVASAAVFGTSCGEVVGGVPSGICSGDDAAMCVTRGCGDGFVEPGPTIAEPDAPARELCDDGNLVDGDACDSSCLPTSQLVHSEPYDFEDPFDDPGRVRLDGRGASIAVDDAGRVLSVWRQENYEMPARIMAVRQGADGSVLDAEPIELFQGGFQFFPVVVGLAEGWLVAYRAPEPATHLIARVVEADGTLRPTFALSGMSGVRERTPRFARMVLRDGAGGFVDGLAAVWQGDADLRVRRFVIAHDRSGGSTRTTVRGLDEPFLIDTPRGGSLINAAGDWGIAGSGQSFMVTWTAKYAGTIPGYRNGFARRFNAGTQTAGSATAIDMAPFALGTFTSDGALPDGTTRYDDTHGTFAIGLADASGEMSNFEGDFIAAWVGGYVVTEPGQPTTQDVGDVYVRLIPSGAVSAMPEPVRVADDEVSGPGIDMTGFGAPVLARIPPTYIPTEYTDPTMANLFVDLALGRVLIAWVHEGARAEPRYGFATLTTDGDAASLMFEPANEEAPFFGAHQDFAFRARYYDAGLSVTSGANFRALPGRFTRGVWVSAGAEPSGGEDASAPISFFASLLPLTSPLVP